MKKRLEIEPKLRICMTNDERILLTNQQTMVGIAASCRKDIGIATISKFQSFPQFLHG